MFLTDPFSFIDSNMAIRGQRGLFEGGFQDPHSFQDLYIFKHYPGYLCFLMILIIHVFIFYFAFRYFHHNLICTFTISLQPCAPMTELHDSNDDSIDDPKCTQNDVQSSIMDSETQSEKTNSKAISQSLSDPLYYGTTVKCLSNTSILTISTRGLQEEEDWQNSSTTHSKIYIRKSDTVDLKQAPSSVDIAGSIEQNPNCNVISFRLLRIPKYIKKLSYVSDGSSIILTTRSCPKLNRASYPQNETYFISSNLSNPETISKLKANDDWTMKQAFSAFCRIGGKDPFQTEITLSKIDRWFHQAKLFGNRLTPVDTAINFKYIARNKRRLSEDDFDHFLETICRKKKLLRSVVVNQLLECGRPESYKMMSFRR